MGSSCEDGFTGKPDLVLRRPEGLVVIDYKSGELNEDPQEKDKQIESWRHQVMFYASLTKTEFGEWPISAEIHLLNKKVIPIPIDPQEVERLMEEAKALRTDYNRKIDSGVPHSELAQYSAENCRFCEFKGSCDTFWKENPPPVPGDERDKYGCLSGQVSKAPAGEGKSRSMTIISGQSGENLQEWQISNLSTDRFENLEELEQGTLVRLIDFKIDPNDSCRAKPPQNSVIWELPRGFSS